MSVEATLLTPGLADARLFRNVAGDHRPERPLPMAEVRWQTHASAERTLATMSDFELCRRLHVLLEREGLEAGGSPDGGASPGTPRLRTAATAG